MTFIREINSVSDVLCVSLSMCRSAVLGREEFTIHYSHLFLNLGLYLHNIQGQVLSVHTGVSAQDSDLILSPPIALVS